MRVWTKNLGVLCAALCGLTFPATARAFCGFYVASAEDPLFNQATKVVMMREGNTTVLSMQNDYRGPPQDFAMVVPVPVVLHEENVRTLPRAVFERVERLASPRLVEYWEQDPCEPQGTIGLGSLGTIGHGAGGGSGSGYGRAAPPRVVVEAEFEVGEYEIAILSAADSGALDAWLRQHHYRIPEGAERVLRPYVESGMKFFVARVNVSRVAFEGGRAVLSPLRFHYQSSDFSLPVRLGLLNSAGTQDLVVHVLARDRRYEVANYENVTIPTNLDVRDDVRANFGEFYAALFDRTLERNPGAVVTEYAWQASGCDPCPGPVLSERDLATLGADVTLERVTHGSPSGARQPRVRVGPAAVEGSLDPRAVRRVVRRNIGQVRRCYARELREHPELTGRLDLGMAIVNGRVSAATVSSSSLPDERLHECVRRVARRWRFPPTDDAIRVVQPLVLVSVPAAPRRTFGPWSPYQSFVLTRLHYRYERDELGADLVFREASPIVGGRGMPDAEGALVPGALPAPSNSFQGRYVIRHPWTGAVTCEHPRRGIWGGTPGSLAAGAPPSVAPLPATSLASAHGERMPLGSWLAAPVPSLGIDRVGRDIGPGSDPGSDVDDVAPDSNAASAQRAAPPGPTLVGADRPSRSAPAPAVAGVAMCGIAPRRGRNSVPLLVALLVGGVFVGRRERRERRGRAVARRSPRSP